MFMPLKKNKITNVLIISLILFGLLLIISNFLFFYNNGIPITLFNLIKMNLTAPSLLFINFFTILYNIFIFIVLKKIKKDSAINKDMEKEFKPFKNLLDNAPAVVIYSDQKGYFRFVNKSFQEITGYSKEEVLKAHKHISEFYKDGIDEAKMVMDIMRKTDKGGIGKIIDHRIDIITRYKEIIPSTIFANIVYDDDGNEAGSIGFIFDIRDRLKLEDALEKSKDKYKKLIENAGEGIYIRQDHQFKYANRKFKEMLGYADSEEFMNLPITTIIDESSFNICSNLYCKILNGESVKMPYETVFKKKNGDKIFVEITINPVEFEGKKAVQGFVRDVTDKKILEEKLKNVHQQLLEQSIKDELTNLYNYRYFRESLKNKYAESKRYNLPLSLLMLDLDDFKNINDIYGHLAGDFVLKEFAQIILKNVRSSDIPARYGGEEFAILLPNTDSSGAKEIAERLIHDINIKKFIYDISIIKVTTSVGISTLDADTILNEDMLIKYADEALYYVKKNGKNNLKIMNEE